VSNEWKLQHHVGCECARCVDHPSQARPGLHVLPDRLHVVTMLENPLRWRSRYWNYWMFERECEAAGAILHTAEVAFGERHFEVTQPGNPRHLQLRTTSEIWHKENALNLLMQRLPAEAKYVAWIDADVKFNRPDWAQETLQLLQHYDVLQMFSHAQDVGPNYEPLATTPGFLYKWVTDRPRPHERAFMESKAAYGYYSVHSGQFAGKSWDADGSRHPGVGRLAHGIGAGGASSSEFVRRVFGGLHPAVPGMAGTGGEIHPTECGLPTGTGEPPFSRGETGSCV
jgi:hypothetical protein